MTELFHIASDKQDDWQYSLTVSMTEIYNEQVHDLLGSSPGARLDIKQGAQGNFVQGLTWVPVQNIGEINEVHPCAVWIKHVNTSICTPEGVCSGSQEQGNSSNNDEHREQ